MVTALKPSLRIGPIPAEVLRGYDIVRGRSRDLRSRPVPPMPDSQNPTTRLEEIAAAAAALSEERAAIYAALGLPEATEGLRPRFWSKVEVGPPAACWPWKAGKKDAKGYGAFGVTRKRIVRAHRVAWMLSVGPIPKNLYVLHRCDNPRCVNPSHLFLGTHADNMADMVAKGRARSPLGALNGSSILVAQQVKEIRARQGKESQSVTGRRYGVSQNCVSRIQNRKNWAWLP